MCHIQSKVVGQCVPVKSGNVVKKEAITATVYGRLLHDMAVSRFDCWPKLPKLKHLGVSLPRMSVKYLFTVTRWDLPKKVWKIFCWKFRFVLIFCWIESFARSLDLYWFQSIAEATFVYTWLEALQLSTQWLSCDAHIRSYIESEWIIWLRWNIEILDKKLYWNIG